ncbi:MAG: hypothetical protein IJ137_02140 [Eubacterium sp.]|nr:hypothetical protein [Eubacterium sp.]
MGKNTIIKKRRNWKTLMLFLLLLTLLTGCRKQTDAEKKRYILSLYIERQEEEYRFRLSEADLTGDMEKEASIPCKVIERIDGSLKELEKNERNREASQLEWNHIYTIFIGPKLAACPERLLSFLGEWDGAWQKSPNVSICLVQSSAASIFEDELEDAGEEESRIGQKAAQLMEQAEKKGGVCRTPIDILKAYDDGSRRLRLYCLLLDEKTKEIRINPGILSFQEP